MKGNLTMNGRIALIALLVVVVGPSLVSAQQPDAESMTREQWLADYRKFGVAATLSFPYGSFGDDQGTGYGLQGLVDYPVLPLLNLAGTLGWSHFPGDGNNEALNVWYVNIGARLSLAGFFMSGQAGYYSEIDEWGWVPGFGYRFTQLEIGLEYVSVSRDAWTTLHVGWYF